MIVVLMATNFIIELCRLCKWGLPTIFHRNGVTLKRCRVRLVYHYSTNITLYVLHPHPYLILHFYEMIFTLVEVHTSHSQGHIGILLFETSITTKFCPAGTEHASLVWSKFESQLPVMSNH